MATEDPSVPPSLTPRKRPARIAREISDALELPIVLVACIAIGGGLGYFLDSRMHTSPLFVLVLGAAGFAAGMRQLLRRLTKDTKDDGGS